jgi:hypothetical protein
MMVTFMTKNAKNFFDSTQNGLNHLFHKIKERDRLNSKIMVYFPETIRDYYQISNFNLGKLIIIASHASAAMELNYRIPDLLKQFKNDSELKLIKEIQCKIDPRSHQANSIPTSKSPPICLSKTAARLILETAQSLADPHLKKIMEKIAAHGAGDQ